MAINIKASSIRKVRSKLKLDPSAFEKNLPESITIKHVEDVDAYRATFLEAAITAGTDMVADTLIGVDGTDGFKSATIVVPMGTGCTANMVVKPSDTAVAFQIKLDTTLTSDNEGVLSAAKDLTRVVQGKMKLK